jgi:poly(hydroxyalkanoate) depolymerase family esterase
MKLLRLLVVLIAVTLVYASLPSRTTQAASLVEVTNFGTNPTSLRMFEYVPNSVTARPAILVAVHFCTGSGPVFFSNTEFASLADRFGFIVVYPSATRSGSCFDVSTAGALTHNGNSDPVGIVSMVRSAIQRHNGDPNRVFVTGASSGGMMTNVLLGDYPDVFKAGAAFMGVPFACFRTDDPSMWNNTCANGQSIKTPQQWGDLVRGAFPGYTGPRPRMQLWHGTADTTLRFPNFGEAIKQWTNVFGISQTPSTTDTPQSGWTHTTYKDSAGTVVVEGYAISGVGHSLPLSGMAAIAIHFFGLDGAPQPTPTPAPGGNLLTNGSIESGTTGWAVFGSGSLSSNTSVVHGGSRSLLITGRTASWNGPSQNMTSKLTSGRSYTTNVWVRTQSGTPSAKVTLALTVNGSTSFLTLAPARAVNASGWTLLSGSATVSWSGTLSSATFYVETTSGTDSFFIDDASVQ